MSGVVRYHITMFVTSEEEHAIRNLYKQNNWMCLLHELTDESVAKVFEGGFGEIFPFYSEICEDFTAKKEDIDREVKTEVSSDVNHAKVTSNNVNDDIEPINDQGGDFDEEKSLKDEEAELGKFDDLDYDGDTDLEEYDEASDKDEKTDSASEIDNGEEAENGGKRNTKSSRGQRGRQYLRKSPGSKKHSQEKLKEMGYLRCEACGNFYFGRRSLRHHYYHVHRDLMPKPSCPICNQQFETYKEMQKHKREKQHNTSVWMLKSYQCDGCGKILSRYSALMNHKKYVCGKGEEEDQELRVHPCDICGKKYKTVRDVKSHKKVVHFNVECVCDICGKVCLHRRAMHSHRRRHDQANKTHLCKYCGKAFFSAEVLEQHVRTHTKEKPYKCPLCKYTSAVMGNITKHTINIHKQKMAAIDLRKTKTANESGKQNPELAAQCNDVIPQGIEFVAQSQELVTPQQNHLVPEHPDLVTQSHELAMHSNALVTQNHEFVPQNHALDTQNHALVTQNHTLVTQDHTLVTENPALVTRDHAMVTENHEFVIHNHALATQSHAMLTQNHEYVTHSHTLVTQSQGLITQSHELVSQNQNNIY